jgi:hypothetical protein
MRKVQTETVERYSQRGMSEFQKEKVMFVDAATSTELNAKK